MSRFLLRHPCSRNITIIHPRVIFLTTTFVDIDSAVFAILTIAVFLIVGAMLAVLDAVAVVSNFTTVHADVGGILAVSTQVGIIGFESLVKTSALHTLDDMKKVIKILRGF